MPRALSVAQRRALFRRWRQKQAACDVARRLDLSLRTVQRLFARFEAVGEAAVSPGYDRCGEHWENKLHSLHEEALQIRREHPTWGAELILVKLHGQHPRRSLPCGRT